MEGNIVLTLEQWRKLRGLTQESLAKKVGVTTRSIGKYERDVQQLESAQYSTIRKIAEVLDIEIHNLYLDSTKEKPEFKVGG